MGQVSALPETTVRIGCENCPNKRELQANLSAFCLLVGTDTQLVPIRVEEQHAFEVEYDDGQTVLAYSPEGPTSVERVVGASDCPNSCRFEEEIDRAHNQITQQLKEIEIQNDN